ncbi:hypothetical protein Tco_0427949 [Tanacetum coccineum]
MERVVVADWFKKPEKPLTPDPDWSKRREVDFRPLQTWISQVAHAEEPPTSFDELNDTSFDFSAFVINRLKIPNLTQEILVGPAFNLLKGTCKSITELEKPLPLIQDQRGRQIIPKDYFINKDLEYLKGGDLSRRYSTLVTKTKAATYELKWIEDLVPELWSPVQMKYDQHAYFGTSHWGPKRQSFYGYACNLTSSKDVYSKIRIIAVTRLTIMKKYDYDHLEEIEVRRDDQKLYTFKEGYRQAALLKEVDAESREVRWWKGIRDCSQAARKDNMTPSYFVSTHFSQNRRDLPRDIPLDSVVVLRYEKRSKSENKGRVQTEIELVLEQTQQVLRMASAAVKPYQEDSLEFYLITSSIYIDQRGTVVIATVFDEVTKTLSSISVDYN